MAIIARSSQQIVARTIKIFIIQIFVHESNQILSLSSNEQTSESRSISLLRYIVRALIFMTALFSRI